MKLTHPVEIVRIKQPWMGYPGHKGQDYGWVIWAVARSRRILAAAPGKVVRVIDNRTAGRGPLSNQGYGSQIIIEHAPKVFTAYNHILNGSMRVKVGDTVTRGQHIATMGMTGDSAAGVHLHFELRLGGIEEKFRVNPAPYFTNELPGTKGDAAAVKPDVKKTFPDHRITTAAVNIRKSPDGEILKTAKKGLVVRTGKVSGDWVHIRTSRGTTGWMHRDFLVARFRRTSANLNFRSTPNTRTSKNIIDTLPKGTPLTVLGVHPDHKSGNSAWRKVRTAKGRVGYVAAAYLKA